MTSDQSPLTILNKIEESDFAYFVLSNAFEVSLSYLKPGRTIAPHSHEHDVYNQVLAVDLMLSRQGRREVYQPGEWMYIPAGQEHAVETAGEVTLLELWRKLP